MSPPCVKTAPVPRAVPVAEAMTAFVLAGALLEKLGGDSLDEMKSRITTAASGQKIDMVTLGCPLLSIEEMKAIYRKMQTRKVKEGVHFWIYLTQET